MAFTVKTTDELKNEIKLNIVANVDTITDLNVGSGIDMFVTSFSEELNIIYQNLDDVYDASRIDTATDDDLEQIGKIVGVTRNTGSKSEGIITFKRGSSPSSNLTITQGTQVSTQPNIESEQLLFNVKSDTTFYADISEEENTFINGLYKYRLDQRFIDSITTITGIVSSSGYTFAQGTDYSISEDVDIILPISDNLSTIDDCEATTGWTADDDAGATSLNSSTYYQGSNSLNLIKTGGGGGVIDFGYHKTLGSVVDFSNKTLFTNIYITAATLLKISTMKISFGSGGALTNSYYKSYTQSDLSEGWNRVYLDYTTNCTKVGYPDIENINQLQIEFDSVSTSDAIVAGDLLMDFWFISTYENYQGDIITFDRTATIPDTSTTIKTTYKPLSVEVVCESDDVGVKYNLGLGKINYKVSAISGIDSIYNYEATLGGVDIETDTELKTRIQSASDLANVATVNAIEANVLAMNFVKFVDVKNLPEVLITTEAHYFTDFATTPEVTLNQQVPIDDSTLTVTGTGGPFVKDRDYILNNEGQIEWQPVSGSVINPTPGTVFYVTYNANKLGYFYVYVTGYSGNLNSSQIAEVEDKVDEVKSAGVVGEVKQPTYISVSVTCTATIESNYDSTTVKTNIQTAIDSYIDALEIGEDVLLAGVITAAMNVEGCENITVSDIGGGGASDYSITDIQIADPGTVSVL